MYTAVSGQVAIAKQIDIIANNLANLNTAGFKAERLSFEKVLTDETILEGNSLKKDLQEGSPISTNTFVKVAGSFSDLTQGPIEKTGAPLDAAIMGKGFFVVQTPEGERYTRAGNFRRDETGKLVTQSGYSVMGQGGEMEVKGAKASISSDGSVIVDGKTVGKLRVVEIEPSQLKREAGLLFKPNDGATVTEKTNAVIEGGAVEGSNVNAVRELADMIMASRLYESFQNVQQSQSKMNEQRNQVIGTTS